MLTVSFFASDFFFAYENCKATVDLGYDFDSAPLNAWTNVVLPLPFSPRKITVFDWSEPMIKIAYFLAFEATILQVRIDHFLQLPVLSALYFPLPFK